MIGGQGGDGGQFFPVEFFGLPESIVHFEEEGIEGSFEFDHSAIASGFQIAGGPLPGDHTGVSVAESACPERDEILFRQAVILIE